MEIILGLNLNYAGLHSTESKLMFSSATVA